MADIRNSLIEAAKAVRAAIAETGEIAAKCEHMDALSADERTALRARLREQDERVNRQLESLEEASQKGKS
jgi:hypothetical protein